MIYFTRQEQRIIILIGIFGLLATGLLLIKRFQPEWYMLTFKGRPDFDVTQDSNIPEDNVSASQQNQENSSEVVEQIQSPKDYVPQPIQQSKHESQESQIQKPKNKVKITSLDQKININTASIEELKSLPRIGDILAQRIVEYRKENGGFKSIEELTKVNGIGEATLQRLRDFVVIEN